MYDFNKAININNKNNIKYDAQDDNFSDKDDFIALLSPKPLDKLPSFASIMQNSLKNRYDIKIAKQEIDVAKKNLVYVTRQRIPDLEIQGGYGFITRGMSDSGSAVNGAYAGANIINIPLFMHINPKFKMPKCRLTRQS